MIYGLAILFIIAFLLLRWGAIAVGVQMLKHPPRRTAGSMIANGYPCDPREAGYEYETIDWRDEAIGINRELWIAQGEQQDGPVLVMIHGWGDSKYGMLHWLPAVAKVADKVVMFDLRAHGDNNDQQCTWGTYEKDDLNYLLSKLKERYPNRKIILMGFSMGGTVAARCVAEYQDPDVVGLILESPYRHARDAIIRTIELRNLPKFIGRVASKYINTTYNRISYHVRPKIDPQENEPLSYFLNQSNIPALVIHGREDVITPLDEITNDLEDTPDVTIEIFEDSGHLQAACAHPERFVSTISEFIESLS